MSASVFENDRLKNSQKFSLIEENNQEMCDDERSHSALELMSSTSKQVENRHRQSMLKMIATAIDSQEEIYVAHKVKTSPASGQLESRALRRRSKKLEKNQMTGRALRSFVQRLFIWSARNTFNSSLVLQIILLAFSLVTLNIKCDDGMHQTDVQSSQQNEHQHQHQQQQQQQQQQQVELFDLIKQQQNQRDSRGILNLDELLNTQGSSSSLSYNLVNPTNQPPMAYNNQESHDQQAAAVAGDNNANQDARQQQQEQQMMQEHRANDLAESDQLETAQTSTRGNSVASSASTASKSSESSEKAADVAPAQSNGAASPTQSISSSSSSANSLADHFSAVNNLLHQAGQIGLSAAQQNVALSEAIINSVTNSLVGNNRKQNAQQIQPAQVQVQQSARPTNLVGQSIDGNIDYNPNTNTIDGFINFPTFNGSKPSLSGVRPLLLAAIKTAPIKFGSVGWKLLKLLAWKKIYKAHHPKSGEIIIEQEMKHGGHGGGGGGGASDMIDKGNKLGKISDHFENKFKTSKMGNSFNGGASEDWSSMMRTPGLASDMFSNSWPHGDSHAASASMIYQRHLLPPGATNPLLGGGGASQHQAAAAAAAAAATAAAIQSHWQQQQQQQMLADETSESQNSRSNQTSGQASALRRKKATYGGSNWFAANPAHTYAAAAAAANAAAAVATQQQQQQQHQRLANIMRVYELSGQSPADHMSGPSGSHGGNMHHALATGLMYQSLFDNAAAMAVQNTVRLSGMDHPGHHQNPLANAEFLDQSDTLSGSSFDSFASSGAGTESLHDSNPLTMMQRHDLDGNFAPGDQQLGMGHSGNRKPSLYGMHTVNDQSPSELPVAQQFGSHRSDSIFDSMPEFDDSPAGKLIGHALNDSTPIYPGHHRLMDNHRQNIKWN